MSNWYIGQKVVCVKSIDKVKKGLTYTIQDIQYIKCCNGYTILDIGLMEQSNGYQVCGSCKSIASHINQRADWYHDAFFRPFDSITNGAEELLRELDSIPQEQH